MNLDESKELIIAEGIGEDGIVVQMREGGFPTSDRMQRLLDALDTLFRHLKGSSTLDRNLAHALFALSFHVQGDIGGMIGRGWEIPGSFLDDEMVKMFLAIEGIFQDEWML